jgi:glycosyltransferase involved in cell wall biosynthesis
VAAATSTTGGGERHVADLIDLLPARGIELCLVAPPGGDLATHAASAGIPFHRADIAARFSLRGIRQIRSALKTFEPDIVHAHGSRAAFYARMADPSAVQRVVYTLHGIHVDKAGPAPRKALFLAIERRLCERTARFITVCEADILKGGRLGVLRQQDTVTVYNGVAAPEESRSPCGFREEVGVEEGAPLVLSVGRFHEQKDQATLLHAWAAVHERYPGATLVLMGSGRLESSLRRLAGSLPLAGSVRIVRPRADLDPAYRAADIFVLSSLWEGLPYVLIEAMSFALPVASTNVDGIPEAVEDGVSGLLVPPCTPEALAGAIGRLLRDPATRVRMGETGRRIVRERFGLERMADEVVAVYRDVGRPSHPGVRT